jgi:hypothetical protein
MILNVSRKRRGNILEKITYRTNLMRLRYRMAALLLAAILLASVNGKVAFAAETLADVENSYAKKEITALVESGILSGFEDGSFRPDQPMIRAELAKVLVLSLGLKEDPEAAAHFTDIPQYAWYRGYVGALVKSGITQGTSSNTFSPSDQVTREALAVFFIRAFGLEEKAGQMVPDAAVSDLDQVSDWAKPHVSLALQMGFLKGMPNEDGTVRFAPVEQAQRQALARLAYEFTVHKDTFVEKARVVVETKVKEKKGTTGGNEPDAGASAGGGAGPETAGAPTPGTEPATSRSGSPAGGTPPIGGTAPPAEPTPPANGNPPIGGTAPPADAVPLHIQAAIDAIQALPTTESLTISDKSKVAAARMKVNEAKQNGAIDADITNLNVLTAAEAKIAEREAAAQTPAVPMITSASANIGGRSVAAAIGNSNVVNFTLPASLQADDRFTGFTVQASGDVQKLKVTFAGISKTVNFYNGVANVSVSQLLGSSLDPQGDGVSVGTLRSLLGANALTVSGVITDASGTQVVVTLIIST